VAALFMGALALYAAGRSPSMDDWDSVNFVKAIGHFDMRLQQPHPPGYPAYVFLGRVMNLFTHDARSALTLLSAICGALCVLALYGLAGDIGAGWAALPLAVMPLFWLNSEMVLSDVPGLLFAVAAVWLIYRATLADEATSRRWYLAGGCGLAGFGAGVRPQDTVIPLAVLALYAVPRLLLERGLACWRDLLLAAGVFVVSCLLWAIPLLASVDGDVQALWQPVRVQMAYVREADSLLGQRITPATLQERLAQFGSVFSGYFGGPREAGLPACLGLAAALIVLALLAGRRPATWLALSWLVSYGAVMVLVMQPTDPRKVLPAIPPMFLLLAAAAARKRLPRTVGLAVVIGIATVFAVKGLPLVRTLHTQPTPPEQAVAYIAAHYSPADTVITAGNSLNHVYYELPEFDSIAIDFVTEQELAAELAAQGYRYVISLDEWDTSVPLPSDYVRGQSFDFERDPLVLPKASVVPFTVYERQPG